MVSLYETNSLYSLISPTGGCDACKSAQSCRSKSFFIPSLKDERRFAASSHSCGRSSAGVFTVKDRLRSQKGEHVFRNRSCEALTCLFPFVPDPCGRDPVSVPECFALRDGDGGGRKAHPQGHGVQSRPSAHLSAERQTGTHTHTHTVKATCSFCGSFWWTLVKIHEAVRPRSKY